MGIIRFPWALVIAGALSAAVSWQVQDWRFSAQLARQDKSYTDQALAASRKASEAMSHEQTKRLDLEAQLAKSDQDHTQEIQNAKLAQARLRDSLATADVRLSVLLSAADSTCSAVSAAPSAIGMVHGSRRAELDAAHAQRIIAITDDGDNAIIALSACQAYARKISGR